MFADDKLHEEMDGAQRTLLNLAHGGRPRPEFLYEASLVISRLTGASALDLWFDDVSQVCHWSARGRSKPEVTLATLSAGKGRPLELALTAAGAEDTAATAHELSDSLWRVDGDADTKDHGECLSADLLAAFSIDEGHEGALRLVLQEPQLETMASVCKRLAKTIGVVLSIHRVQTALAERIKELTCMYNIAQVAANTELSLEESCQETVELLPQAWQYPAITTARIVLDNRSFCSKGFREGPQRMAADIHAGGGTRGYVEVFYLELDYALADARLADARPFLSEEHHLLQGVAREVAFIVERKHAEEERSELRDQVRHADRLATIGQLAAGVAHELNEPLGSVLGFSQLLAKAPELEESTRRDAGKITDAALYAREVVKKLLLFARETPSQKTQVPLNRVVEEATELLRTRYQKAGISMKRDLDAALPAIQGDSAQLQQVLVNLVVNAIQASSRGDDISIRTLSAGDRAVVEIEDSGDGIAPEHIDKLFLPFFTTKDVGKGTGLGLAVVHGIVSAHGGTVEVDTKSGEGALFRVLLPISGPKDKDGVKQ